MLSWKSYTKTIDIWSVGCILAELFNRKPLFPGKNYMDQLVKILSIIGLPNESDLTHISSAKAKEYIRSLSSQISNQTSSLEQLFPNIPATALDLLKNMLTFSPYKRYTVEQCLSHPFLELLHDINDEPIFYKNQENEADFR